MRVRFAPSPTGFLHIGNARTAVINYLIAQKEGADMVLRIEDTDMERSTRESEESIMHDLKWLGIQWTEGPDAGGDYGPYRQSERFDIYNRYTEQLLDRGNAFRCYCTPEEVEEQKRRAEQKNIPYRDRCRNLTDEEISAYTKEGKSFAVRFKVPTNEPITVRDAVKGLVEFNSDNIGGDFVIVRTGGVPVFNYIVVIDDALMKITHVIRGEDHLSNTPKQVLVARALGLPEPVYAHLALVLGPDRSKLSKRHGITSVEMYRKEGYLPDALLNYLAMLGWAAESGDEIMDRKTIISQISLDRLAKSAAVFDFQKLRWMNNAYIKSYPVEIITELFIPYLKDGGFEPDNFERGYLEEVIAVARNYCDILSDINNIVGIFLNEVNEPDKEADSLLREEDSITLTKAAKELIGEQITSENFVEGMIPQIKEHTSFKGKKLFMPVRAVLTGRLKGPELDLALPLIGFERCRKRIEYCHEKYCV